MATQVHAISASAVQHLFPVQATVRFQDAYSSPANSSNTRLNSGAHMYTTFFVEKRYVFSGPGRGSFD